MKLYLPAAIATVLIVAAGLVQWTWTGFMFAQMTDSEQVGEFVRRLDRVPRVIGDWEGEDQAPTDAREAGVAGIKGEVQRRYRNRETGDVVYMSIVAGNHYDIAVHVPTQCYVAAGFDQLGDKVIYPVATEPHSSEMYTTVFKKEDQKTRELQRIFWTWTSDGQWQAPESPRMYFAGAPALYKMYLTNMLSEATSDSPDESPCVEFARAAVPELEKALFSAAAAPPGDSSEVAAAGSIDEASVDADKVDGDNVDVDAEGASGSDHKAQDEPAAAP